MRNILYVAILIFSGVFVSCSDKWDNHYSSSSVNDSALVSSLNLLEYLKTIPDYSKFVEALESTGVAEELTRDQDLTVWAVNNEAMEALSSMNMTDTFIMEYHVNHLSFSINKLTNGLRIQTLNEKYISVAVSSVGTITLGSTTLVKGNQFCKNGVVHEISGLMEPVISIYEYIVSLDNDYSMIRDAILATNDTVFDASGSTPTGVDITGNTIYDSTFVIENPLLDTVDFRSEYSQVTMFLPSNTVVTECLDNLKTTYEKVGKTYSSSDSVAALAWIIRAIFFNELITGYGSTTDLTSAFSKVWRTTVQQVNTEPLTMSNGYVYDVTYLKIPTNVYLTRLKSLVYYYEYLTDEQKATYYTFYNDVSTTHLKTGDKVTFTKLNLTWTYYLLYAKGSDYSDANKLAVEFNPIKLTTNDDGTTTASLMEVPPGEYYLYMGFQSSSHPYVNVYFNGDLIKSEISASTSNPWNYDRTNSTVKVDGSDTKWDGLGGLVGTVTIPGNDLATFKIKVEFERVVTGKTTEELKIYHWALVPTSNNY
jgi:hypothetical protein